MPSSLRYADLNRPDAPAINKAVDYYLGRQEQYVIDMLDGKLNGFSKRHDWRTRGFTPRFFNVTKSIVDKSGMLFNAPPVLEVWDGTSKPQVEATLNNLLASAEWLEFFQNVDTMTRLVKTTCVLVQRYVAEETTTVDGIYKFNPDSRDALTLLLLHHGIAEVVMDPTNRYVIELAYLTTYDCDDPMYEGRVFDEKATINAYRVITPEAIEDWVNVSGVGPSEDVLIASTPNVDGFVPAYMQHDTNKPHQCAWNDCATDLPNFQELYNLALTDTEFAVAHQKQKTLFVNADIVDPSAQAAVVIPYAPPGNTPAGAVYQDLPAFQTQSKSNIGGLGTIVRLKNDDNGQPPLFKFDGPVSDLTALDELIRALAKDIAFHWDVNMRFEGIGPTSGFSLIVQNMNMLILREKRGQFFEAGFKRFYQILMKLYPELTKGMLLIRWAPPALPVNEPERVASWVTKISLGLGSPIDFFMQEEGLSREEAVQRAQQIAADNKAFPTQVAAQPLPAGPSGNSNGAGPG